MKKNLLYSLVAKAVSMTLFALPVRRAVFTVACFGALTSNAWSDGVPVVLVEGNEVELSNFYVYYLPATVFVAPGEQPLARRTDRPPQLKVIGGGTDLPTSIFGSVTAGSAASFNSVTAPSAIGFNARFPSVPCRDTPIYGVFPLYAGRVILETTNWFDSLQICFQHEMTARQGLFEPGHTWALSQRVAFLAPTRRKAVDGGQYDASPMTLVRNGQPWMTYHWGYRLGLVASDANWNAANLPKVPELATWPNFPDAKDNFELVSLPPPWVEDDVIEYVNRADFPAQPGGQYFYAVLASDKNLLDSIPAWQRSGKSFKSGGYVSACRFYGGKNGGPNTHFYSADDKECTALKAIPQLSYEGQTFAVNVPLPGAAVDGVKPCPVDSKALYRVYNNASASNGRFVSNHRYLTEKADVAAVVAQGWVDEGQVMCVPQ